MLINLKTIATGKKATKSTRTNHILATFKLVPFFCFRSPVHFRPSTLQRPATAEGQGHLKQCPKARRSINRRSLLSSFCNSLPTYLFFKKWTIELNVKVNDIKPCKKCGIIEIPTSYDTSQLSILLQYLSSIYYELLRNSKTKRRW